MIAEITSSMFDYARKIFGEIAPGGLPTTGLLFIGIAAFSMFVVAILTRRSQEKKPETEAASWEEFNAALLKVQGSLHQVERSAEELPQVNTDTRTPQPGAGESIAWEEFNAALLAVQDSLHQAEPTAVERVPAPEAKPGLPWTVDRAKAEFGRLVDARQRFGLSVSQARGWNDLVAFLNANRPQ